MTPREMFVEGFFEGRHKRLNRIDCLARGIDAKVLYGLNEPQHTIQYQNCFYEVSGLRQLEALLRILKREQAANN